MSLGDGLQSIVMGSDRYRWIVVLFVWQGRDTGRHLGGEESLSGCLAPRAAGVASFDLASEAPEESSAQRRALASCCNSRSLAAADA